MYFSLQRLIAVLFAVFIIDNIQAQLPSITSFSPASGPIGSLVTITGTGLSNPTGITIGSVSALPISNTGTSLVVMVMPGTVNGRVKISTANGNDSSSSSFSIAASLWPNAQQGNKLVGTGNVGEVQEGYSLALSSDGSTAIVGGPVDNSGQGAVWIYVKNGGVWSQQGNKLTGAGVVGYASQGKSVAISADGNTAIVGGSSDNGGNGAIWVYKRTGTSWTQQDNKLVGTGNVGNAGQGQSVAISADGNTIIVGGSNDNNVVGAAWIFTRSGNVWTQQGNKLVGTDGVGASGQGWSVSISADANTAIIGGYGDNGNQGAVWIFTRNGNVWTQQGSKLVGSGIIGQAVYGNSVSLSTDGNTAIVGGYNDNNGQGAAWVLTRNGTSWSQQGNKLVGTGNVGNAFQGTSVSLSADGNLAIIGGYADNSYSGAAWIYRRNGNVWTQQSGKLIGTAGSINAYQGACVALSADGNTALVGGYGDNILRGATWVFTYSSLPVTITNLKALSKSTGIQIEWQTKNETNLFGYEVERSADGINFVKIGVTAATGDAAYNWLDATPFSGSNYYRLKMIDKDGSFKYSSIMKVKISDVKNVFTIAGNPVKNGQLTLQLENVDKGNYSLTIFNNLGQKVAARSLVHEGGSATQIINLIGILKGSYQLNIVGKNVKVTQQFLVQ